MASGWMIAFVGGNLGWFAPTHLPVLWPGWATCCGAW